MKTPIYDFVKAYAESNPLRLHMPGHKGTSFLGCEAFDITEIEGADSLYSANGIILESENNTTALFGSAHTFYSTEGSSHCIRAMLYLIKSLVPKPKILAGRNAHKTFISAAALLDIDIEWIYGENYLSCAVSPEALDDMLSKEKRTAVYLTSPDYLGNTVDIAGISRICKKHGVILAVDNAHGAYLKFLSPTAHPLDLGADICCDSAHKTLPSLTGGAYLHISNSAPTSFLNEARNALSTFGSTSPSFIILQSLDLVNKYISDGYREKLRAFCLEVKKLKSELTDFGYKLVESEPLKITVESKPFGYSGNDLAKKIISLGGIPDFYDPDFVVMMITPDTDLRKLKKLLFSIDRRDALHDLTPVTPHPIKIMTPHDAIFSASEELDIESALGRTLASVSVSCPPAIPLVVCGEIIDESVIEALKYYGIKKCRVVKP